jgi:hypothetical protein
MATVWSSSGWRGTDLGGSAGFSAFGASSGVEFGFFESVGVGVDGDDFAAVDESIDDGDDGGGRGKDFVPLGEGFVGSDEGGAFFVASGDDLEEEVSVFWVVGEISELVDDEELWRGEEGEFSPE